MINYLNLLNNDSVYEKLLEYGLFPESLEKIFTSESFGNWVRNVAEKEKRERATRQEEDGNSTKLSKHDYSLVEYRLTRNNNAPRILQIPHPIAYAHLCERIRESWSDIVTKIKECSDYETRSMVTLQPNHRNKRLISMRSYNKDESVEMDLRLDKQFGKKYQVHADISNCYPSIYSHAVSWALLGRETAKIAKEKSSKEKTEPEKRADALDTAIRRVQRSETIGIPIGPDTSGLIAEIILSQIDKEMSHLNYDYLRFIDDYTCYCRSREQAETFLRDLSNQLEHYRLKLNPLKTKIVELPTALNEDWIRRLRSVANHFLREKYLKLKDIDKINDFIDLAIQLCKDYPNESPLKYMVRVLSRKIYVDKPLFKLVFIRLSRIGFKYPYVIDGFNDFLKRNQQHLDEAMQKLLSDELSSLAQEHLDYRRSDALIWCIYLAIQYNVLFSEKSFSKLESLVDETKQECLVCLMLYQYAKHHKMDTLKYLQLVEKLIASKDLYLQDEWWLYIYQLFMDNPKEKVFEKMAYPKYYRAMKKAKVSFLRATVWEVSQEDIKTEVVQQENENLTTFPIEILKKKNLTELYLGNNPIQEIPTAIEQLKTLQVLSLENTKLTTLPNEIWKLSKLQELNLASNPIEKISASIGQLNDLRILKLTNTKLTTLPDEIWKLSKLKQLNLSSPILASLPPTIGLLNQLNELYYEQSSDETNIVDIQEIFKRLHKLESAEVLPNLTIPAEIGNLIQLRKLTIKAFRLGDLPDSLSQLMNLTELTLNGMSKKIPYGIWHLSNLKKLCISGVIRADSIPNEIGLLNQLTVLNLSRNLAYYLPQTFSQLTQLVDLNLSHNSFYKFPKEIFTLTNLRILNLSNNQLGSIPADIRQLHQLTNLNIANNSFRELPSEIWECRQLTQLDISGLYLKDISFKIGQLSQLVELNLERNKLSELPKTISHLINLISLNLGINHLENLPTELADLPNLKILELKGDSFRLDGKKMTNIPAIIWKCKHLEQLILAKNEIKEITSSINELKQLKILDISDNKLTRLPDEIGLLSNLIELDLTGAASFGATNQLSCLPETVKQLKKLKKLNLEGNPISEPEKQKIKTWLPHCEILF